MKIKELHPTLKDNRVICVTFLDKDENMCSAVGVYVKEDAESVEIAFNACGNTIKDYARIPKKNIREIQDVDPRTIRVLR